MLTGKAVPEITFYMLSGMLNINSVTMSVCLSVCA